MTAAVKGKSERNSMVLFPKREAVQSSPVWHDGFVNITLASSYFHVPKIVIVPIVQYCVNKIFMNVFVKQTEKN